MNDKIDETRRICNVIDLCHFATPIVREILSTDPMVVVKQYVIRFVSDFDSRIFYDLVLHYSTIGEDESNPRYYLHDCYPAQFINDERTQANIKKNAMQWETFTKYLESKGKLKK
ncbi:hypothetical protein [Prevotella sp. tf2-5]|uniref:hypothetical protein n=1 Tax=Prevotella sp. tf2-5 TaxID=1761889 RepID=UPI0011601326|nr:hypothetical protein [Prevotella sp. tf2-5]